MTPPDSDASKKRTPEEWRKLADEERRGAEQGVAFLDAVGRDGCMSKIKPDSDTRNQYETYCPHGYAYGGWLCTLCHPAPVVLPLSLAQRILAALRLQIARELNAGFDGTADRLHALADELRARLPR